MISITRESVDCVAIEDEWRILKRKYHIKKKPPILADSDKYEPL